MHGNCLAPVDPHEPGDVLLGIPTAYGYGSREIAGFLLYGHFYGLVQHDMIREALLTMYSDLAHQYTRGM